MKLPNGDRAVVDMVKLTDYCLDPNHLRGRHKARVFASALGLTASNAGELRDALLKAARAEEAVPADQDQYGQRFVVDLTMARAAAKARTSAALGSSEPARIFRD